MAKIRRVTFFALLVLCSGLWAFSGSSVARAGDNDTVELHAHLFMKEGMSWMFHGNFNEPLQATDWTHRFSSMANPETVEHSGIGVLVAALYAHPLLVLDLRESIRRQLKLAEEFVASHPDWVLARDPAQAFQARLRGKRLLVLALEGASGILETEADLVEFIDQGGIRIVNLLHLTDDEYGGVAFLHGILALSSPWAFLTQLFNPEREGEVRVNRNGLTDAGRDMARKLLARGVWLDLAHASDASTRELLPMLATAHQPALYTHTALRRHHGAERGIADWELEEVRKSHGIIGLMPSEDYLQGVENPVAKSGCPSGLGKLVEQYREAVAVLGADSVMMGSDYNGGLPHLKPGCNTQTSIDTQGLWNIGQVADLWKGLYKLGAPLPLPLSRTVDAFLMAWQSASGKPAR